MKLRRRVLDTPGGPLTAFDTEANGSGLPAVLVNALGQGPPPWTRLVDRLSGGRRLITWEPRPAPCAPRVKDQIEDLVGVLAAFGVTRCHLIGWCTGPKVMIGLHQRRPDVAASLVFLNGSFKRSGDPADLDTPYERNLEYVCRTVATQPHLADRLRPLFAGDVPGGPAPAELADDVRAPFRSAASLLGYARQMLDFWSYDALAHAPYVGAPVLAIGAGADAVVSTRRLALATDRFPDARFVEVPGATHYLLYDHPDLVADTITTFLGEAS